MVQFPGYLSTRLVYSPGSAWYLQPRGLPHSATCGSQDVCSSPQLFAAYHDLLRRTAPQASPMDSFSLDHILGLHPVSRSPGALSWASSLQSLCPTFSGTCRSLSIDLVPNGPVLPLACSHKRHTAHCVRATHLGRCLTPQPQPLPRSWSFMFGTLCQTADSNCFAV